MNPPDLERAAKAIEEFLSALGHPPANDPELRETGERVAEAFHNDLLGGYRMDPVKILSETCASTSDGPVVLTGIRTTAMCPHHLLPAEGVVHVGYLPGPKLVGLGAIGRLVQCYARRLVLQEDLAKQVTEALMTHLEARAAACVVDLSPMCMIARGGRQHGARAIASSFAGPAQDELRPIFLSQIP
ncbi:MAG: GTP cyclohydrolase I [Myxococcota bacterium]